ncbi:MAG: DUF4394 domain-containing protein [Acidimicrobiia bacterium]
MRTRMLHRNTIGLAIAAALTTSVLTATVATASSGKRDNNIGNCETRKGRDHDGLRVIGLGEGGTLSCINSARPSRATMIGQVSGLQTDTTLVGIDFRPATGELYGVGNAGGIYTIDVKTAAATLKSRLNQALDGTSFGVDFNPTVDRLRIISDTGQNLRANVVDGVTIVDGTLNIPGTPPVSPARGVTAAAYTNNDSDPATATTLFGIDTTNDTTVIQAPANAGSLSATGKLGVDAAGPVGFDIYSKIRNGTTTDLRAFASIASADGSTGLYEVDLLTGRVAATGMFKTPTVDIAIPTQQN